MSEKSSTNALESFINQAKSLANVESAVDLVAKVVESPLVHSFGEILEIPIIKSVKFNK